MLVGVRDSEGKNRIYNVDAENIEEARSIVEDELITETFLPKPLVLVEKQ